MKRMSNHLSLQERRHRGQPRPARPAGSGRCARRPRGRWAARRRRSGPRGEPRCVDHRLEGPELVQDDHDRRPAAADAERVGDGLLADQVDAGVRLVEHEQLGLTGESACHQHALLLAAGEGRHRVSGSVGEPDRLQCLVHGAAVGGPEPQEAGAGRADRGDHLAHGRGHARAMVVRCGTYPSRASRRTPPAASRTAGPAPVTAAATRRSPSRVWTCRTRWRRGSRRHRRPRP